MSTTVVIRPAVSKEVVSEERGDEGWKRIRSALNAIAGRDPACEKLLAQTRNDLRRERLAALTLRSFDLRRLTQSARESRFTHRQLDAGRIRLATPTGAILWAARTPDGLRLVGQEQAIRSLLVANTASRALEHLRSRGLDVTVRRSVNGELSIAGAGIQKRKIDVTVRPNGEAKVEPANYGKSCGQQVNDLAHAVEGEIAYFKPKPEYFGGATVAVREKQHA